MRCGYPIKVGNREVPCGQCMPCRITKRMEWTGRMLLEAQFYNSPSTFLTLTYNDQWLPKGNSLNYNDIRRYFTKLRQSDFGKFRFFVVGEYGEKSSRAHWHAILFGKDPEVWEDTLREKWSRGGMPLGHIFAGTAERKSIQYCAHYTTKKLTKDDDPRLDGRAPEMARMSKFPPIGDKGFRLIKTLLETRCGSLGMEAAGDVPHDYKIGDKRYPIPRYYREWLREELNIEKATNIYNTFVWKSALKEAKERGINKGEPGFSAIMEKYYALEENKKISAEQRAAALWKKRKSQKRPI